MLTNDQAVTLSERVRDELNIGAVFEAGGLVGFVGPVYVADLEKIVLWYNQLTKEVEDEVSIGS